MMYGHRIASIYIPASFLPELVIAIEKNKPSPILDIMKHYYQMERRFKHKVTFYSQEEYKPLNLLSLIYYLWNARNPAGY